MKAVNQSPPKSHADCLGMFWTLTPEAVCARLHCGLEGLSSDDAKCCRDRRGDRRFDYRGNPSALDRALILILSDINMPGMSP